MPFTLDLLQRTSFLRRKPMEESSHWMISRVSSRPFKFQSYNTKQFSEYKVIIRKPVQIVSDRRSHRKFTCFDFRPHVEIQELYYHILPCAFFGHHRTLCSGNIGEF